MIWQSEVLWHEAGQKKDATVAPLSFELIETINPNRSAEEKHDAEADRAEMASAVERNLRLQEERHAAEIEERVRRVQVEEHDRFEVELSSAILKEREAIAQVCRQLGDERQRYFNRVEGEIVKLSLAIATQILHREVKLDPLLLSGVVQVALGQIQEGSDVVLRVPKADVDSWNDRLESSTRHLTISVTGDDRLSAGDCMLETNVGSISLGVKAQLAEIEQGFFDLLRQRPA